MPKMKLTKTAIDRLPLSQQGQVDYCDTELKGFGVRVGASTKTYFVLRRVNGNRVRTIIERHNVMTLDQARDKAKQLLIDMKAGTNPNTEKKKNQDRGITLQEAYEEYKQGKSLKQNTIRVDESLLHCHLKDWLDKPIQDITPAMLKSRYVAIRNKGKDKPLVNTATNTIRMFKRVYNNASESRDFPANPSEKLHLEMSDSRKSKIKNQDLPLWFNAVLSLDNLYMKNYLLLQLFTGMRKEEGLGVKWENVDMKSKTFTIPQTKNGRPLTLPMSSYLSSIFKELQTARLNEFVFPEQVAETKTGHMSEPKRQVKKVKDTTGIEFCIHDLRRTFKTAAARVVSTAENHNLTNHISKNAGDNYIILELDELKEPMQRITDKILALAGRGKNGKPRSVYAGMNSLIRGRILKSLQRQIRKAQGGFHVAHRQQRNVLNSKKRLPFGRITCQKQIERRP
jgi:integrase